MRIAKIYTTFGGITVRLFDEYVPGLVDHFVDLDSHNFAA